METDAGLLGSGRKAYEGGPLPWSLFIPKEKSPRGLLGAVLCGIWGRRGGKRQTILGLLLQFFFRLWIGVGSLVN